MNSLLKQLKPYPFERLRADFSGLTPKEGVKLIDLTIGEPQHPLPSFVSEILNRDYPTLAHYPYTGGSRAFKKACMAWLFKRHQIEVNEKELISVNGSREALFSFAQTVLDPKASDQYALLPNPFYQIYEGAAILGGAQVVYVDSVGGRQTPDWESVAPKLWDKIRLVFVCSPSNPTGAVLHQRDWETLFALQDRYHFVIASDECYSEIYFDQAPLSVLSAAKRSGRDFSNKVLFESLSKRSNLPGLRSGFVAGDAALIDRFLQYRTYHGSAMSPLVQELSIAAWQDEYHVEQNRVLYREKFAQVMPILQKKFPVPYPEASFYVWLPVKKSVEFAKQLYINQAVKVLPGTYLARTNLGHNPGENRVRLALVADIEDCLEAARRIVQLD